MCYVLLKLVRTVNVVVVGVVADDDVGILDHVLDVAEAWNVGIRESLVGIWPVDNIHDFLEGKGTAILSIKDKVLLMSQKLRSFAL